VHCHMKLI
jgi:hypothetical protein